MCVIYIYIYISDVVQHAAPAHPRGCRDPGLVRKVPQGSIGQYII